MADEPVAGVSAELGLNVDGFLKAIDKSGKAGETFQRRVNSAFDKITGVKATQQAQYLALGLEKAGGVAKLTAQQLQNLKVEIEGLGRAGAVLPDSLGQAMTKTSGSAGQLADGIGRVSTTLARSVGVFGISSDSLRSLDDAADIAELGLKGAEGGLGAVLTKSTAFSAATLGAAGAAGALGFAIGSWLAKFPAVAAAADKLVFSIMGISKASLAAAAAGPAGFDPAKIAAGNAEAQQRQVDALRAQGKSYKEIQEILKRTTPALKEQSAAEIAAASAAKQHADAIQGLADALSGADLEKQLSDMAEAVARGITLTDSGKQKISEAVGKAMAEGLVIPAALIPIQQEFIAKQIQEIIDGAIAKTKLKTGTTDGLWSSLIGAGKGGVGQTSAVKDMVDRATAGNEAIQAGLEANTEATFDWGAAIGQVSSQLQGMGSMFGGVLGNILGGIGSAIGAFGQLRSVMNDPNATSSQKKVAKGQMVAAGIGALAQATGASMDSASAGSRAMAGAAMGAQIGAVAGPWGAAAGAVVGAIVGAFKKPSWVKVGKDAAKALGLDEALSAELSKAIESTMKELDLTAAEASLLHLTDVMDETGKSASEMAAPIGDLMEGIASGAIPAAEGMAELEDVFSKVRDEAKGVGDAMTVSMLKAAQATGTMTDGMKAFVSEQNQLMAGGAAKIAASMKNLSDKMAGGEMGARAAQFFVVGFQAAIEEQGLLGALDSMGADLLEMFDKFKSTGNTAAAALVAPFANLQKVLGGDSPAAKGLRSQVELLQGMGDVFEGAANQGLLTAELTAAFGAQLNDSFNALTAGGVDSKTAMQAIMPDLQNAVSAARELGIALDPATAGLVASAEGMGFSFPVEPMMQVVDLLKVMVTTMGGELPASVQTTTSAIATIPPAAVGAGAAISTSFAAAGLALDGVQTAAVEASSTLSGAFMGIGEQLSSGIGAATDSMAAQFAGVWDSAGAGLERFTDQLGRLDGTRINIPFGFGGGGGPDLSGIPHFAHGGEARGPKSGYLAMLHGDELVTPMDGPNARGNQQVNYAPQVIINGSGLSRDELVSAVDRALKNNERGLATRVKQLASGGD